MPRTTKSGNRIQVKVVPDSFPAGKQRIGKIASSTGIYGKHVGGQKINTAVRVRKGR